MLENVVQEYLKKKHETLYHIFHFPPTQCKITLFLKTLGGKVF